MKRKIFRKFDKRLLFIEIITIIFFSVIIFRLIFLNVIMGTHYKIVLNNKSSDIIYGDLSPRGRIYDRNMNVIVDNIEIKSIIYKKENDITSKEEIELAKRLSDVLDLKYGNLTLRNLKEYFLVLNEEYVDGKITDKEYEDLENRKLSSNDIYELKIDRITEDDLNSLEEIDKKAAYIYYLMNKGYYYEEKIIKENSSDNEYYYVLENVNDLKGFDTKLSWERTYPYKDVFRSILGSVSSIPKESKDYYLSNGYLLDDIVGISGIEKEYEDILRGERELKKLGSDKVYKKGKKGNDIVLNIDINLQKEIEDMLKEEIYVTKGEANTEFYNRSFVVITNPKSGEIISIAGKQIEYDQKLGKYEYYDYDEGAIIDTVTPGSVVKGASITVGYNEKVIDIGTTMYDSCIKFLNMPEKCSWTNLGLISDLDALKWSSNVYQYKIAMLVDGFDYSYNKEAIDASKKTFDKYRNTFYQYGLGTSTGIDYPKEETGYKGGEFALDLLINFAIGQYDTYTPLQLVQYVSTIANNGSRMKLNFLKSVLGEDGKTIYEYKPVLLNKVKIEDKYLKRIQDGFHQVMLGGTGVGFIDNNYNPAGKTGTSESFVDIDFDGVVDNETISNNFIGYAPFDNPTMAISVSSPDVQNPNRGEYKSDVNYRVSKKATDLYFKYYNLDGKRIN